MTANYEQPDAMNKRVRFYDGQFLQDQDFVDEQKYHLGRRQRLTRLLHVAGIAGGLEVRTTNQSFQVRVTAGTAVDPDGRLLVLTESKTILDNDGRALLANASEPVLLPAEAASGERWLYIAYHQMADDLQASGDGVEGETRWHEAPFLFTAVAPLGEDDTYDGPPWHDFLVDGPPAPVLLARLTLDADGAVTIDNAVRRYSGLRLPGLRTGNQAAGLRAEGDGRVGLWSLKDGDLTEHLSVTEKGYVGVGTPTPNAALEIRTELKATVQNRALVGLHISPNFNANNISGVREYGLVVERGSVGIGTIAPNAKLEVIGGGGTTVDMVVNGRLRSDNNDGGLWVASDRFVGGHSTNKIGFYNGAWRLTVQNDGKVGIGTATPDHPLDVSGTIRALGGKMCAGNDTANYTEIGHGGANGYINMVGEGRLDFRHEGTNLLTLTDTGNVGIGMMNPTAKLEISADTTTAGGWLEAIRLSRSEHSAITHPGGGLLFGMHGDRNFYFGDIRGGTFRKYVMTVNADSGNLTVNGGVYAGNSDIYFTKTDHNHTGIGNTAGYAAIENAANYNALMILGRAGTDRGRYVRLWDYLQVNGDLEVTGEIRGKVWYSGEYEWSQGQSHVRMLHSSKCVAFLTFVRGKFEGGGEYVQVYIGSGGYWYLGGASAQSGVMAKARCVGMP